jgi:hypothetical protein
MSYFRVDPRYEKRTKNWQDVADTSSSSKRGCSDKALVGHHPHPPCHHPSHSSEEEDNRELLKRHTPFEWSSHLAILSMFFAPIRYRMVKIACSIPWWSCEL